MLNLDLIAHVKTVLARASNLHVRTEARGLFRVPEDEIRRTLCARLGHAIAEALYDDTTIRFTRKPRDGWPNIDEYRLDLIVMRTADLDELTKTIVTLERQVEAHALQTGQ